MCWKTIISFTEWAAPWFVLLFLYCGGSDGFALTSPSGLNNHFISAGKKQMLILTYLSPSLSLSPSFSVHRPSTKTICFWRKRINTSIPSLPGRPTPTHTSTTSTPTMTINPQFNSSYSTLGILTASSNFVSFLFLCALYWDSCHHAWVRATLRLNGSCYVMKTQTHVVANREKPSFSQVPLGYSWKAYILGDSSRFASC